MFLKVSKYIYILWLLSIFSLFSSYYLEYFQSLQDSLTTFRWILGDISIYLAGALYLFLIYLIMFTLIGNIHLSSVLTTISILAIGIVHFTKLSVRVEPLYPTDFSHVTQIKDVIPMISEYLSINKLIIFFISLIIILYFVKLLPKIKIRLWEGLSF